MLMKEATSHLTKSELRISIRPSISGHSSAPTARRSYWRTTAPAPSSKLPRTSWRRSACT